jgi:dimethylargininase
LIALTRGVSARIAECELTFIDRQPIDFARAVGQHQQYQILLRSFGISVVEIPSESDCPDCCFIEDTALILDEVAVIARPGSIARRPEVAGVVPFIVKYRELVKIESPGTLEGGDVLRLGRNLFVGVSTRTNAQGIQFLRDALRGYGYSIIPVSVPGALHLKSVCAALDDETLLADPTRLDITALSEYEIVKVPSDEWMAADLLRIGGTLFLHDGFPKTLDLLKARGRDVRTIDLSEFLKAEAGPTCLSLLFNEPAA